MIVTGSPLRKLISLGIIQPVLSVASCGSDVIQGEFATVGFISPVAAFPCDATGGVTLEWCLVFSRRRAGQSTHELCGCYN